MSIVVVVALGITVCERGRRGSCRLRGVVEDWASEADGFVEDEVIELIMLETC